MTRLKYTESEREYIERCIEEYSDCLIRVAYSISGSDQEAEDVVQEVFTKLYKYKPKFNSKEHEKAWLIRVTVNQAKSSLRKIKRLVHYEESMHENIAFDNNEQRAVHEAVRTLESKYRIIIYLYYFEGYNTKEISQILSVPLSTVGTRFERAKSKLRTMLNMEGL